MRRIHPTNQRNKSTNGGKCLHQFLQAAERMPRSWRRTFPAFIEVLDSPQENISIIIKTKFLGCWTFGSRKKIYLPQMIVLINQWYWNMYTSLGFSFTNTTSRNSLQSNSAFECYVHFIFIDDISDMKTSRCNEKQISFTLFCSVC